MYRYRQLQQAISTKIPKKQDNVHVNTESVQCISVADSDVCAWLKSAIVVAVAAAKQLK